jgi:hypothetical protein
MKVREQDPNAEMAADSEQERERSQTCCRSRRRSAVVQLVATVRSNPQCIALPLPRSFETGHRERGTRTDQPASFE